ncbi:Uncaracterized surface protein containing fasciclin (FAS1) repeats [Pricia antarctica]|uniref:Uncaracterized surface protein containing fasciclin (FAS1) repeats n=2 Tax=Pricia antarctica TaxID=641691 RepID=A0A1G7DDY2_9FLAO|nr:Uncaracterized surface protein containing fasciclin (FAS1) repeats [Pricia antarctica]
MFFPYFSLKLKLQHILFGLITNLKPFNMKNFNFKTLSALTLVLFMAFSCSDDDNGATPPTIPDPVDPTPPTEEAMSIVETAVATEDLSTLVAALEKADLVETLQGDGPFTVFAPTNEAFQAFLDANDDFASLDDIPVEVLTQVLLNHVVAGENTSSTLATGYVSSSSTAGVDGKALSLYVDTTDGVKINGVSVTTADVAASNGVVHIVDQVIGLPNIVDHAIYNGALTSLVGALTADGNTTFTDLLSSTDQKFTVFAPVNDAFTAFENLNGNDINMILANHVIAGSALVASDLSNSYAKTAAMNVDGDALSIYINTDDGVKLNGISTVAIPDIVATNGIIHAVDTVIDLPTVVTFATADTENFSSLIGALTAEGQPDFVSVLSTPTGTDPAPFTVFAPVNSAFEALAEVPTGETLTAILQHHVIGGNNIVAGDLTDGLISPATLEGDVLTFTAAGDGFSITDGAGNSDINIIVTDVQAMNGVVHAIDKMMIPNLDN